MRYNAARHSIATIESYSGKRYMMGETSATALMTETAAADFLGKKVQTLRKWAVRGQGPATGAPCQHRHMEHLET